MQLLVFYFLKTAQDYNCKGNKIKIYLKASEMRANRICKFKNDYKKGYENNVITAFMT